MVAFLFIQNCNCYNDILLKELNLDLNNLANYRPASNLNNIPKILECLFPSLIKPPILASNIFNSTLLQSSYRKNHSPESALLCTSGNVHHSVDYTGDW